jgi:hypothetical protein
MTLLGRRLKEEREEILVAVARLRAALDAARFALRDIRACPVCGAVFLRHNRQDYCTPECSQVIRKRRWKAKTEAK